MTEEEKYKKSVEDSQQKAHEETMWGKPARDIVTGIGNNGGIRPVRAIWELVQNARDVVADGTRARIRFTCKADSLVFQHDGIPFTHKTIEALILQTSSKQSTNNVQVGQYGTGFLTTHKFGLKFKLRAPLKTSDSYPRYFEIPDFEIDRSSTDPEEMKSKLQEQWLKTQAWGKNFNETSEQPSPHTIFSYQFEGEQARQNAESAFKEAPDMVPYVLALNRNVESIAFVAELEQQETLFVNDKSDWEFVEDLTDGKIFKSVIHRIKTNNNTTEIEEEDFHVYSIQSNVITDDEHKSSKVLVILPLTQDCDGGLRVIDFKQSLPQIYIYLPLLGTERWGFNYLIHSPLFTCDKDSRDSLRLVGNGQNNDDQAENNRNLIELSNKLICQFIDKKVSTLRDAKYLVRAAFHTQQAEQKLGDYYTKLQNKWVQKFETLSVVDGDNQKLMIRSIKVLDSELCNACAQDEHLLNAIYDMFAKSNQWEVCKKQDMIYWSTTINRWYQNEPVNPHTLTISDIASAIQALTIEVEDLNWLHTICSYIVKSKQDKLLDDHTLIPNELRQLTKKTSLLHPVELANEVKNALCLMVPDRAMLFVHPVFYDLLQDINYGYTNVKDDFSTYTNNHNADQNSARDQVKTYKKHDLDNPTSVKRFKIQDYEDKNLPDNVVKAMLVLFKALLPEDSESKPADLYNLLVEYYGVEMPQTISQLDKVYDLDARTFYNSLTYDCLFKFSLSEDKATKADWIKRMVSLLYSMSDSRSLLNNYQIYPDQQGEFKYAEWLKKQSENVPDRALDIYDTILGGVTATNDSNSIKKDLLAKDYSEIFVGTAILDGLDQCSEIAVEVEKRGYSITNYEHQKLIVEIVENITSGAEEASKWKFLFRDIDANKGQIMFSVIQSQTKKDSIFTIMKIEDDKKLKAIAELANDPRMDEIIEAGRKAIAQADFDECHNCFIRELGDFVERILLERLQGAISNERLKVVVTDQQGGQDFTVLLDGKEVYYVEVKSRWTHSESVEMSALQFKTSVEEQNRYSLCYVDMTWKNIDDVGNRKYDDLDTCVNKTKVLNDIGKRNEWCLESVQNNKNRTHIGGGYSLIVPQVLFNDEKATDFNGLIECIKQAIEKEMNQD